MRKIGPAQKRKSLYLCVAFILALFVLFPAVTPVHAVMDFDVETTLQILRSWLPLGPVGAPREAPLFQDADHFVFDTVTSPQVAGLAFEVTITARDIDDNIVTDYVGPADLSDSTGTIAPTTTSAFIAGAWTGDVTITQAQIGVIITALDSTGATGDSSNFDVETGALDHIVIRDASNGGGAEVVAQSLTIYDTLEVWAAGYDADNNYKGDYDVAWSLTGDLTAGVLNPSSGESATFTPPSASGTGTIAASHSVSGLTANSGLLTIQAPRLTISKDVVPELVTAGQDLVYTLSYTNEGDAAAEDVRIVETYDPNVSYVSASPEPTNPPPGDANIWTRATLEPGASFEIDVTVNVSDILDPGAEVINQVALSASRVEETTASATAVVTGMPDLSVEITSDPNPVDAGDILNYHVQYMNTGTARVPNAYVILHYDANLSFVSADQPPYWNDNVWEVGTIRAGQGGTIDVQVKVNDFMQDQASLITYAVILEEGDESGFTDVENTLVNAPSLELIKTAEPDPAVADGELVYTLDYSNVGHVATTALTITDGVPADTDFLSCEPSPCEHSGGVVTWDVDGLAPAESGRATLVVDVHANLDSSATLLNMARIHMVDNPDYSASAQVETSLISAPSLILSMSNGKNNVRAGEKLVYILTYRNRGNSAAQDTTIVVTPPAPQIVENVGCRPAGDCELPPSGQVVFNLRELLAGAIGTVEMVASVRDPLPAGARSITASAVISTTTEGDPPGGNEAEDTDSIVTRPDLVVTADYASEMPWPGKRVTYAVHYTNTGHIASTGVVITATQHPNTTWKPNASDECWVHQDHGRYRCVLGNLDYNDSGERLFEVTLPSTPFTSETTDFDVFLEINDDGGSGKDEKPADNDFPAPLGVPDLVITKIIAQPSIWNGQPGFLWAIIKNRGAGRACGRYNPDGCTGFALDLFLDPETPPPSYPIEGYGDCYVLVDPIDSGLDATAVISFTTLSPALWPNQDGNGFCSAQTLLQIWAKVDNWDPTQPPNPADYGLVPETEEDNNTRSAEPGQDIFLPILIRND